MLNSPPSLHPPVIIFDHKGIWSFEVLRKSKLELNRKARFFHLSPCVWAMLTSFTESQRPGDVLVWLGVGGYTYIYIYTVVLWSSEPRWLTNVSVVY